MEGNCVGNFVQHKKLKIKHTSSLFFPLKENSAVTNFGASGFDMVININAREKTRRRKESIIFNANLKVNCEKKKEKKLIIQLHCIRECSLIVSRFVLSFPFFLLIQLHLHCQIWNDITWKTLYIFVKRIRLSGIVQLSENYVSYSYPWAFNDIWLLIVDLTLIQSATSIPSRSFINILDCI